MSSMRSLVLVSLTLGMAACSADPRGERLLGLSARVRAVYVARTEKGAVRTYLNRFATADEQVVVTSDEVSNAKESVRVTARDGETLYLVEPGPGGLAADLPGERARVGGIAVVAAPSGVDAHDALGANLHLAYAEEIGTEMLSVPDAPSALRDRDSSNHNHLDITIERSFLELKLRELTGVNTVTVMGRDVKITERKSDVYRAYAREWLRKQYEALGFTAKDVPYGSGGGVNVVAERPGADGRFLAITAHLDTVGNAGADDDGAGTVAALAIAKVLSASPLKTGLRIVAFDQEELGLLGSTAYAAQLNSVGKLGEIAGVLNLEMIAWDKDNDGAFHAIDCDENTSADLTAVVEHALAADPSLRLHKVDACTNRSDHAAFWRYNRPAIVVAQNFFGGDEDPCYHKSCDRWGNVHFDYMTRMTTLMARTAAAIVAAD